MRNVYIIVFWRHSTVELLNIIPLKNHAFEPLNSSLLYVWETDQIVNHFLLKILPSAVVWRFKMPCAQFEVIHVKFSPTVFNSAWTEWHLSATVKVKKEKSFNTRAEVMSRCLQTELRNRYCNFTCGKMVSMISPTITQSQHEESTVVCHMFQQRTVVTLRQIQDHVVAAFRLLKTTLLSAISFAMRKKERPFTSSLWWGFSVFTEMWKGFCYWG